MAPKFEKTHSPISVKFEMIHKKFHTKITKIGENILTEKYRQNRTIGQYSIKYDRMDLLLKNSMATFSTINKRRGGCRCNDYCWH